MNGYFITLEGGEGAGKTSILPTLKIRLQKRGYDVLLTREPGGIEIAEEIRSLILNPNHSEMDAKTEALLYAAARSQHLTQKIIPALEDGKIVICDRFIDSSLAYQGYARGLGIDEVFMINKFAIQECMPTLTLFFNIEPKKGLERIRANQNREWNRLDLEEIHFHELVYEAYHILLKRYPNRIHSIQADQRMEDVEKEAFQKIISHLEGG